MSLAVSHQPDVHRGSTRTSTIPRLPILIATGATAVGVLIAALVADRGLWTYAATVVLVGFAAVLVINRDPAPMPAQRMQLTVAGERRTAGVLEPLGTAGWSITHDIRGQRLNLDHMVVGPSGPFAMATKTVSGNHMLSGAAEDAVHKWKFVPAAEQSTVNVDINFAAAQ